MPVVDDLLGMMNAIPKGLQLPLIVVVSASSVARYAVWLSPLSLSSYVIFCATPGWLNRIFCGDWNVGTIGKEGTGSDTSQGQEEAYSFKVKEVPEVPEVVQEDIYPYQQEDGKCSDTSWEAISSTSEAKERRLSLFSLFVSCCKLDPALRVYDDGGPKTGGGDSGVAVVNLYFKIPYSLIIFAFKLRRNLRF